MLQELHVNTVTYNCSFTWRDSWSDVGTILLFLRIIYVMLQIENLMITFAFYEGPEIFTFQLFMSS